MLLQKKQTYSALAIPYLRPKRPKSTPYFSPKQSKTILFGAANMRRYPSPPRRKSPVISVRCVQRKDTYLSCLRESSLDLRQLIKFHLVSVRLMVDPWLEFKELKRVALVKCIEREPRSTSLWRKTTNEQLASTFLVLKYLWKYHSV